MTLSATLAPHPGAWCPGKYEVTIDVRVSGGMDYVTFARTTTVTITGELPTPPPPSGCFGCVTITATTVRSFGQDVGTCADVSPLALPEVESSPASCRTQDARG